MSAQAPVADDAPVMRAWKAYTATDEHTNALRWAVYPESAEGSLWTAFVAGFNRAPSSPEPPRGETIADRKPHREICRLCHEVNRVGFYVPDSVWRAAMHVSQWNEIVCLSCFTRLADERGVEWDREIEFYPVSRIGHDRDGAAPPPDASDAPEGEKPHLVHNHGSEDGNGLACRERHIDGRLVGECIAPVPADPPERGEGEETAIFDVLVNKWANDPRMVVGVPYLRMASDAQGAMRPLLSQLASLTAQRDAYQKALEDIARWAPKQGVNALHLAAIARTALSRPTGET